LNGEREEGRADTARRIRHEAVGVEGDVERARRIRDEQRNGDGREAAAIGSKHDGRRPEGRVRGRRDVHDGSGGGRRDGGRSGADTGGKPGELRRDGHPRELGSASEVDGEVGARAAAKDERRRLHVEARDAGVDGRAALHVRSTALDTAAVPGRAEGGVVEAEDERASRDARKPRDSG
jgi:hypothetical protein